MPVKEPATTEQPADFARCLRCVSHELTRDVCGYAGRCVRQATTTTPPPADVVDYTERARELLLEWMRSRPGGTYQSSIQATEFKRLTDIIADALSAVASERDAAAIRAFGQRVWSDSEEVAYQAGVRDTLARLK